MAVRPAEVADIEHVVGLLMNTVPVRARVDRREPALDAIRRLQRALNAAREHAHLPLATVQSAANARSEGPLFDTFLLFESYGAVLADERYGALAVRGARSFERTNYPINLSAAFGDRILLRLVYDRRRVADGVARAMVGEVAALVKAIGARFDATVGELMRAIAAHARPLVEQWNATTRDYARDGSIAELVKEAGAAGRVAVEDGERR